MDERNYFKWHLMQLNQKKKEIAHGRKIRDI